MKKFPGGKELVKSRCSQKCQSLVWGVCKTSLFELQHGISNHVICATSKCSDQPGHTRGLIRAFANRLNTIFSVKLLTVHHLEFLSLKEAAQSPLSLYMSKYHIVGNHMTQLICKPKYSYVLSLV